MPDPCSGCLPVACRARAAGWTPHFTFANPPLPLQAIMSNSGTAMLGVGVSSGKNRAEEAALVRAAVLLHCRLRLHVVACVSFGQAVGHSLAT